MGHKLPHLIAVVICAVVPCTLGCGLAARGQNVSGVQAYQQGNFPLAMQRFQYAQQADPRNADTYYNQAALLHKQGLQTRDSVALSQAESLYNTALLYEPNHVDAHRGLAVLLTETGRIESANTLLRNWASSSPTNADARVELARLSEEIGDSRNAESYLLDALRLDAGNWRAHAALGRQRELQGRYAEAIQNYQRAQSYNPSQPQLTAKIQELSSRLASSALPAGNASANVGAGSLPGAPGATPTGSTANGFNWTRPPGPPTIMANPAAAIGTRSATAPNPNIRY
jgi:tetratricopeptide (TPR) repeat protein